MAGRPSLAKLEFRATTKATAWVMASTIRSAVSGLANEVGARLAVPPGVFLNVG